MTVLQLLNSEGKTCIPEYKKDFEAPRSCRDFICIITMHTATARSDRDRLYTQ